MAAASSTRVTLKDVGQLANVSRVIAGHVLNGGGGNSRVSEETARRVREAARKLNYVPNRAAKILKGGRGHIFGLLVASAGDPLTAFLTQYLNTESVKIGCATIICNITGAEPRGSKQFAYWIDELSRQNADGVFCAVHHWFNRDRGRLCKRHPNTVFYEDPRIIGAPYVTIDREAAARMAVGHLVERGRRRICLALMTESRPTHLARRLGYRRELEARGIAFDENLIFVGEHHGVLFPKHNRRTRRWEFPADRLDRLIDLMVEQKADAVAAHDDYWAAAIIELLKKRGIHVPEDVAVVGYLNHYLADWINPPLTTLDPRHRVSARIMVRMAETMALGQKIPEEQRVAIIRPKLIVREST